MERRFVYFVLGGVFVVVLVGLTVLPYVYEQAYEDRVYPGVYVGREPVGGMTVNQLRDFLVQKDAQLGEDGLRFRARASDGQPMQHAVLPVVYAGTEALVAFADIDIEATVATAYGVGRSGDLFTRMRKIIQSRMDTLRVPATVEVLPEEFIEALQSQFHILEQPVREAALVVVSTTPRIEPEMVGEEFQYPRAVEAATQAVEQLALDRVIDIARKETVPTITAVAAAPLLAQFPVVAAGVPVDVHYVDPNTKQPQQWRVGLEAQQWLQFQLDAGGAVVYGLDHTPVSRFFDDIATSVDIAPQDAKFSFDEVSKKVTQFQPSKAGLTLDREAMYQELNARVRMIARGDAVSSTVALIVSSTPPAVAMSDVNQFGITELLGVGVSKFFHSSKDRIKNIQNASTKLNGVLIAPGEEFSLVARLRPITLGNGYVPEYVIKGDKIEKDVGGGLCQIGTTAFRMAMMSGLPITERYNHSLVVSYYNDLTNNNPGTDATIFDPSRDLKFKNDTGHSLLITTEVDVKNVTLKYYLWGAHDGRKGYYTPPVVEKWIATGPMKEIRTTDQPPGKTRCQESHPGAVTSFWQYIERPDGMVEKKEFRSHYRPLPRICFIGVTPEELNAPVAPVVVPVPEIPMNVPVAIPPQEPVAVE